MDYLPLAVGSETSSQILNCYEGRSSGLNSIKKPKQEQILSSFGRDSLELSKFGGGVDKPVTKMQIYQTTLDKIIERMPKYKNTELIVIDTQGYELEVLKGASETIKNHKMPIIFEYEKLFEKDFKYNFKEFEKFIKRIDYKIREEINHNYLIIPK